jgi:hypothetical protein
MQDFIYIYIYNMNTESIMIYSNRFNNSKYIYTYKRIKRTLYRELYNESCKNMSSLVTNLIRRVVMGESLPGFPYVIGEKLYPADVEREGRIWNVHAATKRVRQSLYKTHFLPLHLDNAGFKRMEQKYPYSSLRETSIRN